MTSNRQPHITLIQPSELLASVPHLLGFHPADSLVVVGLRGSPETTISVVLRSDLPPPSGVRALAEYLLLPLTQHSSTAAVMIVVGGIEAPDDDLPHRELLARCESVLIDGGFPVVHQLWTPDTAGGRRWHCYDEFHCTGIMPDPADSELAAAAADAGMVTYDRREDIVATLEPEPDEVLARRSASLDQLTDAAEQDTAEPDDSTRVRLTVVQSAIDAVGAAEHPPCPTMTWSSCPGHWPTTASETPAWTSTTYPTWPPRNACGPHWPGRPQHRNAPSRRAYWPSPPTPGETAYWPESPWPGQRRPIQATACPACCAAH